MAADMVVELMEEGVAMGEEGAEATVAEVMGEVVVMEAEPMEGVGVATTVAIGGVEAVVVDTMVGADTDHLDKMNAHEERTITILHAHTPSHVLCINVGNMHTLFYH